jgi:prepilin-type processing-associated H-X9-DG protein
MSANSGNDFEFTNPLPKPSSRQGIRLVKIFLGLGILVLLTGLLLPLSRRGAGPAARRSQCVNNMKQIGLALHNYEQIYHSLPPAYTVDANGRPLHSWRTLILPYMEYGSLYQTIDLAKPWNDPANAKALQSNPTVYRCPSAVGVPSNTTVYLAIATPDGCFPFHKSRRFNEITDPHGSTLMVIEAGEENAVPWMAPLDADEALMIGLGPTSKLPHSDGTNACLVDGSVKFMKLKADTPAKVRRALISISGNDDEDLKDLF